ncbi:peptidoglycan-binding protein [Streptomyces longispororuber]|uniref:peptidoglycan-binding protein n=1 Tax=Streptomyces longispororuber TaxID=68230 RepID=UPI0036F969F7
MTTTLYPGSIRGLHWYGDQYEGSLMRPNVVVLHTTEGPSIVSYRNGADAPNLTAGPDFKNKRFKIYQHFALNRSARALVNAGGGVETNTLNVVQIELIGTCDPKHRHTWGSLKAGRDYLFWPDAPDWAYTALAELLAWLHKNLGIPLKGPKQWPAYPASYGRTSARMTFSEWNAFKGVCGHLHVPENHHGDPGSIPFTRIIAKAKEIADKGGSKPPSDGSGDTGTKPKPRPPFPGRDQFGPGKSNSHITTLGKQLVKKGYGRHYTTGPGPKWSEADRKNVEAFQRAQGWSGSDADGLPGPTTWKLLFS